MSHIKWTDLDTGEAVYISGMERCHLGRIVCPSGDRGNFAAELNTAVARSPSLRLAARIHGQCEIGLWVHPKDRAWLADRIMESLQSIVHVSERDGWIDVFRSGMSTYRTRDGVGIGGWICLAEWLRKPGGKVVTSYSVSGRPPRAGRRRALRLYPPDFDAYTF